MDSNENSEIFKENYKKTAKVISAIGMYKIMKIISICLIIFFALVAIIGSYDIATTGMVAPKIGAISFVVVIIVSAIIIYVFAVKQLSLLENVNLYVNNFKEDVDGIIKVSDIAFYTGQTETEVIRNFSKLLQKGYIINCRLERKRDITYIMLNNPVLTQTMMNDKNIKEIVLKDIEEYNTLEHYKCPNCGAIIDIKDINNVVCSYCETKLVFKRMLD